MQQDSYNIPPRPAGTDDLIIDLYSQTHIDNSIKSLVSKTLLSVVPENKKIKTLILGPRCGLTAEIFLPVSSHLDLVEEEPYTTLLRERFQKKKDVTYLFGTEGQIGQKCVAPKPNINQTEVRVLTGEQYCKQAHSFYDVVLLQNCLITPNANLVKQLLKVQHETLLTMLIPGVILDKPFFPFIVKLEKQIIQVYYDNLFHQQIQNRRRITGRRSQLVYFQACGWTRKDKEQEITQKIHDIQEEAEKEILDKPKEGDSGNPYESQEMLEAYLNFHYGPQSLGVANYPSTCASLCIEQAQKENLTGRALDLGCSVGRTTIELAQHFEQVIGLDFSSSFIKAAKGALADNYDQVSHRVKFVEGDACNLQPSLGKFNLIFGGNLIDRLPDPPAFLKSIGNYLEPKGLLILTSPYSWLEQYTPKTKWIGGRIQNGKAVSTNQDLKNILSQEGFQELCPPQDVRFAIKDNEWKYQYTLACTTFWQKK